MFYIIDPRVIQDYYFLRRLNVYISGSSSIITVIDGDDGTIEEADCDKVVKELEKGRISVYGCWDNTLDYVSNSELYK